MRKRFKRSESSARKYSELEKFVPCGDGSPQSPGHQNTFQMPFLDATNANRRYLMVYLVSRVLPPV